MQDVPALLCLPGDGQFGSGKRNSYVIEISFLYTVPLADELHICLIRRGKCIKTPACVSIDQSDRIGARVLIACFQPLVTLIIGFVPAWIGIRVVRRHREVDPIIRLCSQSKFVGNVAVVIWYETHVTYRYAGDDMVDDLPEYTITELPEGYAEDRDQRIEFGTQTYISYQNGDINSTITLHYCYMQQGAATVFVLENADSVPIIVNGCEGQIFLSKNLETTRNAVTWIDIEQNIQFTIQARLSTDDLLHMAESVSLDNLPEIE